MNQNRMEYEAGNMPGSQGPREANTVALTRRTLLTGAGAMAASPWLAGCGGAESGVPVAGEIRLENEVASAQAVLLSNRTPQSLWYDAHAKVWLQALPIGNGRLGAMLYGGPWLDKIQFNENSLWGGASNTSTAWSGLGDTKFGGYRNFGSIQIGWAGRTPATVSSPTGHTGSQNESIDKSIDGDVSTKWCVVTKDSQVAWQIDLRKTKNINGYSITSANDVPSRDPKGWEVYGSIDGVAWTFLERKALAQPFAERSTPYNYALASSAAFRYIKIIFLRDPNVSHFQLANIELNGFDKDNAYPILTSPSGHGEKNKYSANEDISRTLDGNENTKWCVENTSAEIVWQYECPTAVQLNSISLTSANDVPDRDPNGWVFSGSEDGVAWVQLHAQSKTPVFSERKQKRTFAITAGRAFKFYKFVFAKGKSATHFQIANIELAGPAYNSNFADHPYTVCNYERVLDIQKGVHITSFQKEGVLFKQTAFATKKEDVVVIRYESVRPDGQGNLTGELKLISGQYVNTSYAAGRAYFSGTMSNNLKYAGNVQVMNDGGECRVDGNAMVFTNCKSLTLVLDARTNYAPDYAAQWRTAQDPLQVATENARKAAAQDWQSLLQQHVASFGSAMNRVDVRWGEDSPDTLGNMPTNRRKVSYLKNPTDTSFEKTIFDYGRYLLRSSSRKDGLPANLQGLWNDSNDPSWASDYHNNINVQMNYWGAEVCDMGDSHMALMNYIRDQAPALRVATRAEFDAPGWTARTMQNIFGGSTFTWNTVSSAWYAQHVWEHYAFTQDKVFLRETAYPMLTEIVQFWQSQLIEYPSKRYDEEIEKYKQLSKSTPVNERQPMSTAPLFQPGTLVTPIGWSPEIGPHEPGIVYDMQIVWDLFQNYLDASAALRIESDMTVSVADMQKRLAPNKIDSKGRLQEWQTERDPEDKAHRHNSHLFSVFPGRQITLEKTPDLAAAAVTSLKERCNEVGGIPLTVHSQSGSCRSWTWPWRAALFARLRDGYRAGEMVKGLLAYSTYDNLFADHTHGPKVFQMDGNFGITAAIPEMLLQTHEGKIHLLPALPAYWQSKGAFKGLRARGGYKVSCQWSNGKVVSFEVVADRATSGGPVVVVCNGEAQTVIPKTV